MAKRKKNLNQLIPATKHHKSIKDYNRRKQNTIYALCHECNDIFLIDHGCDCGAQILPGWEIDKVKIVHR